MNAELLPRMNTDNADFIGAYTYSIINIALQKFSKILKEVR